MSIAPDTTRSAPLRALRSANLDRPDRVASAWLDSSDAPAARLPVGRRHPELVAPVLAAFETACRATSRAQSAVLVGSDFAWDMAWRAMSCAQSAVLAGSSLDRSDSPVGIDF